MRKVKFTLIVAILMGCLVFFENCDDKGGEETAKDRTLRILQSKQEWVASTVTVPVNSATDADQWENSFTISFTASNMTTVGHPTGAQAVWPSGSYTVSENGIEITRSDGVVMSISPINEDSFTANFSIENQDLGGGRVASLDGNYTFGMR